MSSAKVCQAPGVAAGYPVKGRKEGKPIEPPSTQLDIRAAVYAAQPSEQSSAPPGTPSPPYSVSARRPRPRSAASMCSLLFLHRPGRLRQYPAHQRRPSTPQPVFSLHPPPPDPPNLPAPAWPAQHPPGLHVPFCQAPGAVRPSRPAAPNSETGLFLSNEGKRGIHRAAAKLFEGGGGVKAYGLHPRPPACAAAHTVTHQRAGDARAGKSCNFFASLQLLQRRLLVVVPLAKALMVRRIDEFLPVATVRDDVVHHRGSCPVPRIIGRVYPRALAAPGFTKQLRWAQALRPDRQHIPAVIVRTGAALVPWPVLRAPAVPRQLRTSSVAARPQRFLCHGLSPPGNRRKHKSRSHNHAQSCVGHWLRLSKLRPCSMSTMISCLHLAHHTGTPRAAAVMGTRSSRLFRQYGQTSHPSFTVNSLPCSDVVRNTFSLLL